MEAVVYGRLALGFGVPGLQRLRQCVPSLLHGEVDDAGGAARGGSDGACAEVVCRDGPAEGEVQVRVGVDAPGDHELAGGVDGPVRLYADVGADGADLVTVHQDIGDVVVDGGYDVTVLDEDAHVPSSLTRGAMHTKAPPS